MSEVVTHDLLQIEEKLSEQYETVVQLMPNCPLRTARTINRSVSHFLANECDAQISCFKFGWNNPWWAFTLDEKHKATRLFPHQAEQRSQDLPELYCPTGAVWIASTATLLKNGTFYAPDHRFYTIPWLEAIDIDTLEDWSMAESLFYSR